MVVVVVVVVVVMVMRRKCQEDARGVQVLYSSRTSWQEYSMFSTMVVLSSLLPIT